MKNDGTQFIWAGDLAKIYRAVLNSGESGKKYFGPGNKFITWEAIAIEVVAIRRSTSKIIVRDLGWPNKPALFDVSDIMNDFGLLFDARDKIRDHINYYLSVYN